MESQLALTCAAVDKSYADGIKPIEFGGGNGTADIAKAVLAAL